jgi:hypothetical protein
MAGDGGHGGFVEGGVSRARFLKLAGLGAGLSLFSGTLLSANVAGAQAAEVPDILDTGDPDGRYPIAAWWPPPPVPNTDPDPEAETARRYAELAGAGFNTVIGGNGVGNDRANRLALTACERPDVNVRLVLADARLSNAIKGTATPAQSAQAEGQGEPEGALQALTEQDSRQDLQAQAAADRDTITNRLLQLKAEFGQRRGLAGIFLYDEPGRTLFADLGFARQKVEEIFDFDELPYVNAWPSYAHLQNALEAKSYTDYLERYMNETRYPNSAIAPPFLSFDHYPLLADEKTTPEFFYNHAVIRNFAKRFDVPSWAFVQSMGFDGRNVRLAVRRPPDEAEIFWQINVALAYGAKGIQYFTYWTPEDGEINFGEALIARTTGEQTEIYGYAQRANAFLVKVGGVLRPLNSEFVTHFGEKRLPQGARPFRGYPYVKAASGDPAILGLFNKLDGSTERHLLVVNRSPNKAARTRLTVTGAGVEEFEPSTGLFERVALTGKPRRFLAVPLGAGRARLYRLRKA